MGWSICANNHIFLKKKWPILLGQEHFSRYLTTYRTNLRGYFNQKKFGTAQTGCIFEGLRPLCNSRLRQQEKSLFDMLPLDQNLLKTLFGWTAFLNWQSLNCGVNFRKKHYYGIFGLHLNIWMNISCFFLFLVSHTNIGTWYKNLRKWGDGKECYQKYVPHASGECLEGWLFRAYIHCPILP